MADTAAATLLVNQIDVALTFVGICGGVVAFAIGLRQYKRAEQWKRAEFIASEMKEFFDSARVNVALTLVDWGGRNVRLFGVQRQDDARLSYVTREVQCWALLPHQVIDRAKGSDVEAERAGAEQSFSPEHSLIRDCYDALLDGLERFESYVESEFVTLPELRPYVGYWIEDIAAPTTDPMDAAWTACLFLIMRGRDRCRSNRALAGTSLPNALCARA